MPPQLIIMDYLVQGLGKMVMLRAKLGAAATAVKNFFTGGKAQQDPAVAAMEALRVRRQSRYLVAWLLWA